MKIIAKKIAILGFGLVISTHYLYAEQRNFFVSQPIPNTNLTQQELEAAESLANQGDVDAQIKLGKHYFNHKDYKESLKWYEKAAEKNNITAIKMAGRNKAIITGSCRSEVPYLLKAAELDDAPAQTTIGVYYNQGYCGFPADQQKAIEWYRKAVAKNEVMAQYNLGIQYEFGWGVKANPTIAAEWYQKAVEQGYTHAKANLAILYLYGKGIPQDKDKGLKLLKESAEAGYDLAQYNLANTYRNGIFVNKDDQKAFTWYQKAAQQGYTDAQWLLGTSYLYGQGTNKDPQQAQQWLLKAADKNSAAALLELGLMYAQGMGIPQDYEKAYDYFSKVEEIPIKIPCATPGTTKQKGCQSTMSDYAKLQQSFKGAARNNLGYMYQNGYWVKQDINQAIAWYEKSAELDYLMAMTALGDLYVNGQLTKQDLPKALSWYKQAAERGSGYGQLQLGLMYLNGIAVSEDKTIAKQWLTKAAKQGNKEAEKLLKDL